MSLEPNRQEFQFFDHIVGQDAANYHTVSVWVMESGFGPSLSCPVHPGRQNLRQGARRVPHPHAGGQRRRGGL